MKAPRAFMLTLVATALLVIPASGQRASKQPPPVLRQERPERVALLQQIHQRLMTQARNRLGLTPQQFPKFQAIVVQHARQRAPVELDEDRLQGALREQIRLGKAGNQDSTAKLLSALNGTRARLAAMDADQMHELEPILSPVQRAQWQLMQERFRQQVRAAARLTADSVPPPPQP